MNSSYPKVYFSPADIGAWFGVSAGTVAKWVSRYGPDRSDDEIAKAPTSPQPDIQLGTTRPNYGWDPAREQEWRDWHKARPGRGNHGPRTQAA